MKWIILVIVIVAVGIWLARGRKRKSVADPEVKLVDKENYYVTPPDESEAQQHGGSSRKDHKGR